MFDRPRSKSYRKINLNLLTILIKLLTMRKLNFFAEEYTAPELEVVSTVVEAGFSLSGDGASFGLDDVDSTEYGDL